MSLETIQRLRLEQHRVNQITRRRRWKRRSEEREKSFGLLSPSPSSSPSLFFFSCSSLKEKDSSYYLRHKEEKCRGGEGVRKQHKDRSFCSTENKRIYTRIEIIKEMLCPKLTSSFYFFFRSCAAARGARGTESGRPVGCDSLCLSLSSPAYTHSRSLLF